MIFALRKDRGEEQVAHEASELRPGLISDPPSKELVMTWETPTAIDMRFGMEITMYIANR